MSPSSKHFLELSPYRFGPVHEIGLRDLQAPESTYKPLHDVM